MPVIWFARRLSSSFICLLILSVSVLSAARASWDMCQVFGSYFSWTSSVFHLLHCHMWFRFFIAPGTVPFHLVFASHEVVLIHSDICAFDAGPDEETLTLHHIVIVPKYFPYREHTVSPHWQPPYMFVYLCCQVVCSVHLSFCLCLWWYQNMSVHLKRHKIWRSEVCIYI